MSERVKIEFTLEEFKKIEHYCYLAQKAYQKASDDLDILNDSGKDLLAKLMSDYDLPQEKVSEAKLERLSRQSDEWKQYKRGLHGAIQVHGEAKSKFQTWQRAFDACQSGLSYLKAEFSKLGA